MPKMPEFNQEPLFLAVHGYMDSERTKYGHSDNLYVLDKIAMIVGESSPSEIARLYSELERVLMLFDANEIRNG